MSEVRGIRHRLFARFLNPRHYTNGKLQVWASFIATHEHRINVRARWLPAYGMSRCYRCRTPWWATEPHSTSYSDSEGCFPLCERCWAELSIPERMPYYMRLVQEWDRLDCLEERKVPQIIEAVEAGR